MVHDPVCGMEITDTINAKSYEYKGETYYFCSDLCRSQFEQDSEKYVKKDEVEEHSHHEHHHH